MTINDYENSIFSICGDSDFSRLALWAYDYQRQNNKVYQRYLKLLGRYDRAVSSIADIPCMPVEFFKQFAVKTTDYEPETEFTSSGTTGAQTSHHYIKDLGIYYKSLVKGFEEHYGDIRQYHIVALLPAYLERTGSSLVVMVEKLMELSGNGSDGFFLYDFDSLERRIETLLSEGRRVLLIGVTFALIDYAESHRSSWGDRVVVMETGGMKGRKKEITREEVHSVLSDALGVAAIHSEYGMTELLSQAYSQGGGIYRETSTMRLLVRDATDPLQYVGAGVTGGINVIDLANIYSCCFLETRDLGIKYQDGSFKVLGRFDNSDTRGCNLLYTK